MSVFTEIAEGRQPGDVVWRDERCFVLLSNEPAQPGHVMVVPTVEWPTWLDMPPDQLAHLFVVSQSAAQTLDALLRPLRVVALVAGREIRHAHVHLIPMTDAAVDHQLFAFPAPDPAARPVDPAELARSLASGMKTLGRNEDATC
jgi:diadenosine tetraphosphate (Ap4A) HIT family hydrolase